MKYKEAMTNEQRIELRKRYDKACDLTDPIDAIGVEKHLGKYLEALGVTRKIVRFERGWKLEDPNYSSFRNLVEECARAARAALAAHDAHDAHDALKRFANWCAWRGGWWWSWDLSWISTTIFGATTPETKAWSAPLMEAWLNGCWILTWTEDTLYWTAHPRVHKDEQRRPHRADGPALECDLEDLYFDHGVLLTEQIVMHPETLTVEQIDTEQNVEVRRVMIQKFGVERWLLKGGATKIHEDRWGILYRKNREGDSPVEIVHVVNSTPEPDGSVRDYFLRVKPGHKTALEAIASTFPGVNPGEYEKLEAQT